MGYIRPRQKAMSSSNFQVPGHEPEEGARLSTGASLVDTDDPAFLLICRAAFELTRFGYDPNDPDVAARAIEVGRERHKDQSLRNTKSLAKERSRLRPEDSEGASVVYYMRIGNRVKIGWSRNLTSRLSAINPEELMATEPGSRNLERVRHREFGELRTHGEWFRLEGPLEAHIKKIKKVVR